MAKGKYYPYNYKSKPCMYCGKPTKMREYIIIRVKAGNPSYPVCHRQGCKWQWIHKYEIAEKKIQGAMHYG